LFSVFEAVVRARVLSEIKNERAKLRHRHVLTILENALDGIENGSFSRVLELFKLPEDHLVESVNQVRRYRNWVAHGKRSSRPESVTPALAYQRLSRFLERLGDTSPSAGS
jgi:hypothetical protein